MKRLAIGTLGSIQKLPGLVRNFFSQPECQYIAMRLYLTKKLVRKNIRFIVDESYIGSFSNYPEWMVCRYRLESLMFFRRIVLLAQLMHWLFIARCSRGNGASISLPKRDYHASQIYEITFAECGATDVMRNSCKFSRCCYLGKQRGQRYGFVQPHYWRPTCDTYPGQRKWTRDRRGGRYRLLHGGE